MRRIIRVILFLGISIIVDLLLFMGHKFFRIETSVSEYIAIILLGAFIERADHLSVKVEELKERVQSNESALELLRKEMPENDRRTLQELEERSARVIKEMSDLQVAMRGLDAQLKERVEGLGRSCLKIAEGVQNLRDSLRDGDDMRRAVLSVREKYPTLEDHLKRLVARMTDMAARGTVVVEKRADVYAEDRRLIDELLVNQELGSCVFVQEDPGRQFLEDQDYIAFIEAQVRASLRGVLVRRVYICESAADAKNEKFRTHLLSLKKYIESEGKPRNFEVRVLVLESIDSQYRGEYRVDVLLFGNSRVSEGDLNQLSQKLLRAEYRSDEAFIREAKRKFNNVFSRALSLVEFLREF